jgi:hypothetical protein
MSSRHFDITILDWRQAERTVPNVRVGTFFVFRERSGGEAKNVTKRNVLPLLEEPIDLRGIRITPKDRGIEPLATLCADRDLYRAEEDTVNLFLAVPGAAGAFGKSGLSLALEMNGAPLTERAVDVGREGVAVESFAALLAGRYTARLKKDGRTIGREAPFTVAEYTLAPLSGRLASFRLDRAAHALHLELAVESYQVPFDRDLSVALVESGREVSRAVMKATAPGRYAGSLPVAGGDGPLRLRLAAVDDAGRVCEVAIPGSRRAERETTLVSALGREVLLSLMPEAGALATRGAYLSEGDFVSTPVVVDQVHTARGVLRVQADVEALTLVVIDSVTGKCSVVEKGNVAAGTEVEVVPDPVATVFVGGYLDGEPFEGFTTFFRPSRLELGVDAPATVGPGAEIAVGLTCAGGPETVPVLLCVRDQRLTAADTPESGLGASIKRSVDAATAGRKDATLTTLEPFMVLPPPAALAFGGRLHGMPRGGAPIAVGGGPAAGGASGGSDDELEVMRSADELPLLGRALDPAMLARLADLDPRQIASLAAEEGTVAHAAAPPPAPARAEFPQVLFYGIVPVRGTETVVIPVGDGLGTFSIDAFALAGGDWVARQQSFTVDKPVRADLDLPPAVHESDRVTGTLRIAAASGRAKVSLTRDGAPVTLSGDAAEIATPAELRFDVRPGAHVATVVDVATGASDRVEATVAVPGKFRSLVREVALLQAGDLLTLDVAEALSLRILPGVDKPFEQLVDATADYSHHCCEQTAAKILSASVMYLTAQGPARRKRAESVILAGIAREKRMHKKGLGFSMYPEHEGVHGYYSPLVVRHLWALSALDDVPGLSAALKEAIGEGLAMADDVARPFNVERVPSRIESIEDAYAVALRSEQRRAAARDWIASAVDLAGRDPAPRAPRNQVMDRALLSYAAAALLAMGEIADGARVANVVTRQLDAHGRLYSTVDSVAAIALFTQLARTGVMGSAGRVKVNGSERTSAEAVVFSDQVETVEVLSGVVPVEVTRLREEDWSRFKADLPIRIGFRDGDGKSVARFHMGDRVDIHVELPGGYRAGDLVHVALPAALSWIEGGGRVKRFTKDFEGKSELSVPLVVTGAVEGRQQFAVCVRNMFEEERAASPGLLAIG